MQMQVFFTPASIKFHIIAPAFLCEMPIVGTLPFDHIYQDNQWFLLIYIGAAKIWTPVGGDHTKKRSEYEGFQKPHLEEKVRRGAKYCLA